MSDEAIFGPPAHEVDQALDWIRKRVFVLHGVRPCPDGQWRMSVSIGKHDKVTTWTAPTFTELLTAALDDLFQRKFAWLSPALEEAE